MADLLALDEAIARVLARAQPLPSERVPVEDALGRVLAEDATAVVDLPPFDSSAMDGFAVRSADTPGTLRIVAHVAAGRPTEVALGVGEAAAVATGGVVPDGADAVVPIEHVVTSGDNLEVRDTVVRQANIRTRGGDTRAGDVVLTAGTRVGPGALGALAAAGLASVVCARRPQAAVLATGTELRRPGDTLAPGEIHDSNGPMLSAALRAAGAEVVQRASAADDEAEHREALARALDADVVVSSGGVSVGPHDLVRGVARELGVEEVFWRVAVKPGKPISFAVRGRTLLFGLPGNPVSTLVGFELFVRPALRALEGEREPGPRFERAPLAAPVRRNGMRDELVRARRTADGALEPLPGQDSHMIVRSAAADALVLVRRGDGEVAAGAEVDFLRLSS